MINDYNIVYGEYEKKEFKNRVYSVKNNETIKNALYGVGMGDTNSQMLVQKIIELQNRIGKLENSAAFKLIRRLYDFNIPFKSQIRNYILRH